MGIIKAIYFLIRAFLTPRLSLVAENLGVVAKDNLELFWWRRCFVSFSLRSRLATETTKRAMFAH